MTLSLEYSSAAEADVASAYDWYEEQRPGLGSLFLEELARTDAHISENSEMFPVVHGTARRALLRVFPYGLIYLERADHVLVVAVFPGSRSPLRWQKRMGP